MQESQTIQNFLKPVVTAANTHNNNNNNKNYYR